MTRNSYQGRPMKSLGDRRFATISMSTERLLELLRQLGYISALQVPDDARVVRAEFYGALCDGLRITVESDSLPASCHYRGFLAEDSVALEGPPAEQLAREISEAIVGKKVGQPVVYPDDRGQWILYANESCQEVIGFFPDRADAEFACEAFARR